MRVVRERYLYAYWLILSCCTHPDSYHFTFHTRVVCMSVQKQKGHRGKSVQQAFNCHFFSSRLCFFLHTYIHIHAFSPFFEANHSNSNQKVYLLPSCLASKTFISNHATINNANFLSLYTHQKYDFFVHNKRCASACAFALAFKRR